MWGYHRHNVLRSFHQSHYKPMLVLRTQTTFSGIVFLYYLMLITPHKCLLSFFSSFQTHYMTNTLQWDKIMLWWPKPDNSYASYYALLEQPSALLHLDVRWVCFQTRGCTTFILELGLEIIWRNKGNRTQCLSLWNVYHRCALEIRTDTRASLFLDELFFLLVKINWFWATINPNTFLLEGKSVDKKCLPTHL